MENLKTNLTKELTFSFLPLFSFEKTNAQVNTLTQQPLVNCYYLKCLIYFILYFACVSSRAQLPFDNRYASTLSFGDGAGSEFVTCPSVVSDYAYAAVGSIYILSSTFGQPATYGIRGVRIKSDGTMLATTFDFIQEANLDYNIFPLKIIRINNNSEYLITGYVTRVSGIYQAPLHPFPFVIKADASLNATAFKIFFDHEGFFTDVDEIPGSGGDLLFCGAQSYMTTITPAYRVGWMLRTDPTNFTAQWMRFVYNSQKTSGHNYQIVHDAITLDGDSAIVCGATNERISCQPPRDSFQARAFIAKVNLNTGAFVWQNSLYEGRLGIRLALNNNGQVPTMIAMATHGELNNSNAGLSFFDRGGNLIADKACEVSGSPFNGVWFTFNLLPPSSCTLTIAKSHIIQNIYFMNNNTDVFVSGKLVEIPVAYSGTSYGPYDMPYSMVFDYSNLSFGNMNFFLTAQTFPGVLPNFLTYNTWNISNTCYGNKYPQFFTASNTLPCLAACGGKDKFVTVTLDKAGEYGNLNNLSEDKVWIYSNDQYVCEAHSVYMDEEDITSSQHIDIVNDDIMVSPQVSNLSYYNTDPDRYIFDCIQSTP